MSFVFYWPQGEALMTLHDVMLVCRCFDAQAIDSLAAQKGFVRLQESEKPAVKKYQFLREVKPIEKKGSYYHAYEVVDMFSGPIEENGKTISVKEQKAAYDERQLKALIAQAEESIESLLDSTAQEWGYKNADRCISYQYSSVKQWASDAALMSEWRDSLFSAALSVKEASTVHDILSVLPAAPDRSLK